MHRHKISFAASGRANDVTNTGAGIGKGRGDRAHGRGQIKSCRRQSDCKKCIGENIKAEKTKNASYNIIAQGFSLITDDEHAMRIYKLAHLFLPRLSNIRQCA